MYEPLPFFLIPESNIDLMFRSHYPSHEKTKPSSDRETSSPRAGKSSKMASMLDLWAHENRKEEVQPWKERAWVAAPSKHIRFICRIWVLVLMLLIMVKVLEIQFHWQKSFTINPDCLYRQASFSRGKLLGCKLTNQRPRVGQRVGQLTRMACPRHFLEHTSHRNAHQCHTCGF